MLELAWAKQQYSRYNMAGRIYPAQFSRISSHLRNQGHLNRNYNVEASSKQDIRKDARKRRSCFVESLPPAALRFAFHAPPTPLLRMIAPASCVALYMPVGSEAPADGYAGMLIESGKQLCLPCLEGNDPGMIFRRWSPADSLAAGHASVGQPLPEAPAVVPDAIIAPLLAFDRRLNRLGQGGGHYDRTFARYPHALRIGLAWSAQERDDLILDPWDVPLHAIVTECEFLEGSQ
jgi:5-formyltetrahydrofolate cyclo-ligase